MSVFLRKFPKFSGTWWTLAFSCLGKPRASHDFPLTALGEASSNPLLIWVLSWHSPSLCHTWSLLSGKQAVGVGRFGVHCVSFARGISELGYSCSRLFRTDDLKLFSLQEVWRNLPPRSSRVCVHYRRHLHQEAGSQNGAPGPQSPRFRLGRPNRQSVPHPVLSAPAACKLQSWKLSNGKFFSFCCSKILWALLGASPSFIIQLWSRGLVSRADSCCKNASGLEESLPLTKDNRNLSPGTL